jgi:hypothetical protein
MEKNTGPFAIDKSLSYIHDYYEMMDRNEIVLVYCGDFSQELNKTLLSFTERKFKGDNIEDNTRRKIFNIMVEVLQNISKNKIGKSPEMPDLMAVFILASNDNEFRLISSNLIMNDKIENLRSRLDQVNSLDREGLKQLYKDVRLSSAFSEKSGAGIGIIDIARKAESKLEYSFDKVSEECSLYSLLIRISKDKN